jgi:hypothetical protein
MRGLLAAARRPRNARRPLMRAAVVTPARGNAPRRGRKKERRQDGRGRATAPSYEDLKNNFVAVARRRRSSAMGSPVIDCLAWVLRVALETISTLLRFLFVTILWNVFQLALDALLLSMLLASLGKCGHRQD